MRKAIILGGVAVCVLLARAAMAQSSLAGMFIPELDKQRVEEQAAADKAHAAGHDGANIVHSANAQDALFKEMDAMEADKAATAAAEDAAKAGRAPQSVPATAPEPKASGGDHEVHGGDPNMDPHGSDHVEGGWSGPE